jgi:hypothetical protein
MRRRGRLEAVVGSALVVELLISVKDGRGGGDLCEEPLGDGHEAAGRRLVWP